jgi:hypothetical protein
MDEKEPKSFREMLYGEEYVKREKEIDRRMDLLNEQHADFLKTVKGRFMFELETGKPATLKQYVLFKTGANLIEFGIVDLNKELPENIRRDIEQVYCEVFPELKKR